MLFFAVSLPSLAVAHAETACATQNESVSLRRTIARCKSRLFTGGLLRKCSVAAKRTAVENVARGSLNADAAAWVLLCLDPSYQVSGICRPR